MQIKCRLISHYLLLIVSPQVKHRQFGLQFSGSPLSCGAVLKRRRAEHEAIMTSTVWHPADPKITTVQVQSPYMRYIQVLFLTKDSSHSHRVVLFKGSSPLFFFLSCTAKRKGVRKSRRLFDRWHAKAEESQQRRRRAPPVMGQASSQQ